MNVLVLDGSGSMGINLLRLFDNRGDKVAVTLRKNREAKYILPICLRMLVLRIF